MKVGNVVEIKDLDLKYNRGFIENLNQKSTNFIGRIEQIEGAWVKIKWGAYDYIWDIIWWHNIKGVNIKKISLIYCDE